MTSVLHIVPGLEQCGNGMAVVARFLQTEQGGKVVDASIVESKEISAADEIWVHSTWTLNVWRVSLLAMLMKKSIVRMTHGNLDPVRLKYSGWKKRLAGPIERYILRKCDKIVVTCDAEKKWIEAYLGKRCPKVEVTDVKRFFSLGDRSQESGVSEGFSRKERKDRKENDGNGSKQETGSKKLNLLYLGRRHPLKGVEYLEAAVSELNSSNPPLPTPPLLKIVSNAFGEEKEKVWDWCDVLVLPTLSENFGLVVAEALERGKRVITTDGAPVWGYLGDEEHVEHAESEINVGYGGKLLYLNGFRYGTLQKRIKLLKDAIKRVGVLNSSTYVTYGAS